MSSVVLLQNVGLRYGTGSETLSDLDVVLAKGSFTVVTGVAGAGKTSLLRLATGAVAPGRGIVRLFDADLATLDRAARAAIRRRIGIVRQDPVFVPHLSAAANVALPLQANGRTDRVAEAAAVAETLAWVGLDTRRDALPDTLSGGERQRLALARAVVTAPELIVADEPVPQGDPESARHVLAVLEAINRLGTTILLATRDRSLAGRVPGALSMRLAGRRIEDATGTVRHPPAPRMAYR